MYLPKTGDRLSAHPCTPSILQQLASTVKLRTGDRPVLSCNCILMK
ncbi:MAG: hypothetical protein LH679_12065 [Cyanobacteria bacterium CAN_BIN43]|nr:hypothetical protein [Cyanobacteria bacterium CAN_BIN43]